MDGSGHLCACACCSQEPALIWVNTGAEGAGRRSKDRGPGAAQPLGREERMVLVSASGGATGQTACLFLAPALPGVRVCSHGSWDYKRPCQMCC